MPKVFLNGKKLREIRDEVDWTQGELSENAGWELDDREYEKEKERLKRKNKDEEVTKKEHSIVVSTISRYETEGKKPRDAKVVFAIIKALAKKSGIDKETLKKRLEVCSTVTDDSPQEIEDPTPNEEAFPSTEKSQVPIEPKVKQKKKSWPAIIIGLCAVTALAIAALKYYPELYRFSPWRSDLTAEEKLWEEDLLNWTQFEALPYQRDAAEDEELPADKLLQPTITKDGILLNLAPGSNLELKREIKIPQNKAGNLILQMKIKAGQATEETEQSVVYLIAKGKDPAVLDRFTMQADINRRYNVTTFAGADAQLLLKTQSGQAQPLSFLLEELKLKLAPKGKTITVKAIQSWNKQILDENAGDYWGFYIRLEKLEENQYSFYQRIKTSMDGTTKIENIPPGRYRISLLYSTIAVSEIKDVLISESQGFKGQLSIPLSRMVKNQIFCSDAATPLKGTRVEVYTNGSNSGTALKWMDDETRKATGTEDKNEDTVWLFPSVRPQEDYYIFRAELDGQYIGEANCKLGVLDEGEALVRIVTNVSP